MEGGEVCLPHVPTQREKAKESLHPEACASQHETHHISDEVFTPFLSLGKN